TWSTLMPIEPQITTQSSAIRTSWVTAQPGAVAVRLPWTGFKLDNEKTFFDALYAIVKKHSGPLCLTATDNSNLDFVGWFNYFFNEAKTVAQGAAEIETNFGRIFSLLFDLQVSGAGPGAKIEFAEIGRAHV